MGRRTLSWLVLALILGAVGTLLQAALEPEAWLPEAGAAQRPPARNPKRSSQKETKSPQRRAGPLPELGGAQAPCRPAPRPGRAGAVGLPEGTLLIRLARTADLAGGGPDPAPTSLPSLDRTGRAATLRGQVTGGRAVKEVLVLLGRSRGARAAVDSEGRFILGPTVPGVAVLAFQLADGGTALRWAVLQPGKTTQAVFTVGPPGILEGTVETEAGTPIPGATVQVDGRAARTDRAGRFRLRGIPAGRILLYGESPGWFPSRQRLHLLPGKRPTRTRLVLEKARRFEGKLLGPSPQEMGDVRLHLLPRSYDPRRDAHLAYERLYHLRPDRSGTFRLPVPVGREVTLVAYHPHFALLAVPLVFRGAVGRDPGLELRPRPHRRLHIVGPGGEPLPQAVVETGLDGYDHEAYFRLLTGMRGGEGEEALPLPALGGHVHALARTGPGLFTLWVEPGFPFVDLVVRAPGHAPRHLPRVPVAATEPLIIRLSRTPGPARVHLRLSAERPRRIRHLRYEGPGKARAQGLWELWVTDLPPGRYHLTAEASGFAPETLPLTLTGGTTELRLHLASRH